MWSRGGKGMSVFVLLTLLLQQTLASSEAGAVSLRGGHDSNARALAASEGCDSDCAATITAIHKAEDQIVHTLAMTLEFLLMAVGVDRTSGLETMNYYIAKFYKYHKLLRDGGVYEGHEVAAPPEDIKNDLEYVYEKYYKYKKTLEDYGPYVNNSYIWRSTFSKIESESKYLLNSVSAVVDKYYGYASVMNYQLPPQAELFSKRQLTYLEQMMKEALYIGLNYRSAYYMEGLLQTERLFQESHNTLVYGNPVAGVPALDQMCTLHAMLEVEHYWGDFQTYMKQIKDNQVFAQLFLDEHLGFIAENAADPQIVVALKAFIAGWNSYADTDQKRMEGLQSDYIDLNPLKDKIDLDAANGTANYHAVHRQYHPKYRSILYENNYYDIFFLDVHGNCIYSVYKEADYATNFDENGIGEWKDSGLGEAFVAARDDPDSVHVIDWKPYGPSAGAMASFLSQGIKENGQLLGVFVTQMPPESEPALADPALLETVDTVRSKLETELYNANALYTTPSDACTPAEDIGATEWGNILVETSRQRMLTQKVTRIYFQYVKGIDEEEAKVQMRALLLEGTASVRKCIAGSYFDAVPAPPSQHIVDELLSLWSDWQLLEESMSMSFENNDKSLVTLSQMAALTESCLAKMSQIGEAIVVESLHEIPTLRSVVIEIADRQNTILEKMSKEALLTSVHQDFVDDDTENFAASVDAFLVSHGDLLKGRHASHDGHRRLAAAWEFTSQLLPQLAVIRTTDSCTLNQMVTVKESFDKLHTVTSQIVGNSTLAPATLLEQVSHLVEAAAAEMETAAGFYAAGSGSCDVHYSEKDWESILQQSMNMAYLFQKAQSEFGLVASGNAAQWEANAEAALKENEGFIAENARDPLLAEAAAAFKEGWNKFRPTDAERRMGLQVAYITMNPNPAGSKDILDYAEGVEEYHGVHKQYHPTYRALLYEKNYYDIFFLDLAGNCIYSVYKELDFATNFDPRGEGEWKDSGLGEAYVEGMANPDGINVIDWKPYGPSAGALASFLSTGIRNAAGNLIGIYVTQMHPDAKPIDSPAMLAEALHLLDEVVEAMTFGNAEQGIRPPPSQAVADSLFHVVDHWAILKPLFHVEVKDKEAMEAITAEDTGVSSFSNKLEALTQKIVDGAWTAYETLEGTKVMLAGQQLTLMQGMCRDIILLSMGARGASVVQLRNRMTTFDQNQLLLENGGTVNRRLQAATQNTVTPSKDPEVLARMVAVDEVWNGENGLKALIEPIALGSIPDVNVLRTVVEQTASDEQTVRESFTIVATSTRTTTMLELEILAPMPLTGDWSAGRTMKVASLLAESLINSDQVILPGFRIKTVFFDDRCNPTTSSQVVLRETSAKPTYVALGGAGCSDVCAETSFVAETINLPFVSYECPSAELSNEIAYPSLVRFGTVTSAGTDVLVDVATQYGWGKVFVVTGDQSLYRAEAEAQQALLRDQGINSEYVSAVEYNFDDIVAMMEGIKEATKGQDRVLYVMGTESYYRKVLCAGIIAEVRQGVTWFSIGSQRFEWWKKTDSKTDFQYSWLRGDIAGTQVRNMFQAFSSAWNAWGGPDATQDMKMEQLKELYETEAKEAFDGYPDDDTEPYHAAHVLWHPIFRKILTDREYYDIFVFDLQGNMVYSVYKESDYATNFAANGDGRWRTSGLGDAFEMAKGDPGNVSYVDWRPYGPSGDAPAAFLSTGIVNAEDVVIGVYAIQLPPSYEKSIEEQKEECTLETIAEAYEGAINVAGLGRPVLRDMEKPLPCFKGHSASSFMSLLDEHLAEGFPKGDISTVVESPYNEVKANAADATCAIAMVIRDLHFTQGYSMADIQRPSPNLYAEYIRLLKNIDFDGASGRVKFEKFDQQRGEWEKGGNEKRNNLVVLQVQEGVNKEIGLVQYLEEDPAEKLQWVGGGVMNSSWTQEFVDPPVPEAYFPWFLFQIVAPISIICVPITIGAVRYSRF